MAEYDNEQIERDGLSLQDAFDKIAKEHDLGSEYHELLSNPALSSESNYKGVMLARRSAARTTTRRKSVGVQNENPGIGLRQRANEIEFEIKQIVISELASGEFIAFGLMNDGPFESYNIVPARTWKTTNNYDFENSYVRQKRKAGWKLFNVRLFEKGKAPEPIGAALPATKINPAIQAFEIEHWIAANGMALEEALKKVSREHSHWEEHRYLMKIPAKFNMETYLKIPTVDIEGYTQSVDKLAIEMGGMPNNVGGRNSIYLFALIRRRSKIATLFKNSLLSQLKIGEFIAYGRKNSHATDYKVIRVSLWTHLKLSFEDSTAKEDIKNGVTYFDIQIIDKKNLPAPINAVLPGALVNSLANSPNGINDPDEPPPIPPLPRIVGNDSWGAIQNAVKAHPDRFEWAYTKPNFKSKFAREVAKSTGYAMETCRTLIRVEETKIREIISEVKSNS